MARVECALGGPFVTHSERMAYERIFDDLQREEGDTPWYVLAKLRDPEVDIVVIAPPGLLVIEVKHWSTGWMRQEENKSEVQSEVDRIRETAGKLTGRIRENVGEFRIREVLLLSKESEKHSSLGPFGVRVVTLRTWRQAIEFGKQSTLLDPKKAEELFQVLKSHGVQSNEESWSEQLVGQRLANFKLDELMSDKKSSFRRTYKAIHKSGDRRIFHLYDISAPEVDALGQEDARNRAAREWESMRLLSEKRFDWVPEIKDPFESVPRYQGEMFFFTIADPYAPSIAEFAKNDTWDTRKRTEFALKTIRAVMQLHAQGVDTGRHMLHRNLSPSTIRVGEDKGGNKTPVLSGFMYARLPKQASYTVFNQSARHDAEEVVAPEVKGGGSPDARSDIFSLCCSLGVLFETEPRTKACDEVLKKLEAGRVEDRDKRCSLLDLEKQFSELIEKQREPKEGDVIPFNKRMYKILEKMERGGIAKATFKVVEIGTERGETHGPFVAKTLRDKGNSKLVHDGHRRVRGLVHDNLCSVQDVADEWSEDGIFVLMSWVNGKSLTEKIIDPERDLQDLIDEEEYPDESPVELAVRWLTEMCQAVGVLHENKLVHGDVGPGNMIINEKKKLILIDFDGVGRLDDELRIGKNLYTPPEKPESGTESFYLQTRKRLYTPPEAFSKWIKNSRSTDLYQLAASMFHVLNVETGWEILNDMSTGRSKRVNLEKMPSVYRDLEGFFRRAMDPDPGKRLQNTQAAIRCLPVIGGSPRLSVSRKNRKSRVGHQLGGYKLDNRWNAPKLPSREIYRATGIRTRREVIFHLYEDREGRPNSEWESMKRLDGKKLAWVPRVQDEYREVPHHPGLRFFTRVHPNLPSLKKAARDDSWSGQDRVKFARNTIQTVQKMRELCRDVEVSLMVPGELTSETILVRRDTEEPMLTGFKYGPEESIYSQELVPDRDHSDDVYSLCGALACLFEGKSDKFSNEAEEILTKGRKEDPALRCKLPELENNFTLLANRPTEAGEFWHDGKIIEFNKRTYRIVARPGSAYGETLRVVEDDKNTGEEFSAKVVREEERGKRVHGAHTLAQRLFDISSPVQKPLGLAEIVAVADRWRDNGFVALLKWIPGTPLSQWIGRVPDLLEEEGYTDDSKRRDAVVGWIRRICRSLDKFHNEMLVHGNISPSNMIVSGRNLTLTDYDNVVRVGSHRPGSHYGPSSTEGELADPSDDFFALATSMYHALYGQKPFKGESSGTINWEKLPHDKYPELEDFFKKATDPDPRYRFRTAETALAKLDPNNPREDDDIKDYKSGQLVHGTVGLVGRTGDLFVTVGNKVMGRISKTEIEESVSADSAKKFKVNDTIRARVIMPSSPLHLSIKNVAQPPRNDDDTAQTGAVGEDVCGKVIGFDNGDTIFQLEDGTFGTLASTEIDWKCLSVDPTQVFKVGNTYDARVIGVDAENNKRLSVMRMEKNPWEALGDRYEEGKIVKCRAERPSGENETVSVLIEDGDGFKGIIMWAETAHSKQALHWTRDRVKKGELIYARIIGIDKENRHLKLSMTKRKEFWIGLVCCVRIVDFTAKGDVIVRFMGEQDGFEGRDGIIRKSELAWEPVEDARDVVSIGKEVEAKVIGPDDIDDEYPSVPELGIRQLDLAGLTDTYPKGRPVRGKVTGTNKEGVTLILDIGIEGTVSKTEIDWVHDIDPKEFQVEQVVEATIIDVDMPDRVHLSLKRVKPDPWDNLDNLPQTGDLVECGAVGRATDGGVIVRLNKDGYKGHITYRHLQWTRDRVHLGERLEAEVSGHDRAGRHVTLWKVKRSIRFGQRLRGVVEEIDEGAERAVIALRDGRRGFLHKSDLAWESVEKITKIVTVGEEVEVSVIGESTEARLALGMKQLAPGDGQRIVNGRVKDIVDYGAFIDLGDGRTGLLHKTNMAWRDVGKVTEIVAVGQEVQVMVLPESEGDRIELGMKQLMRDPWESCVGRYKVGQVVNGKIVSCGRREAIVELVDGVSGSLKQDDLWWGHVYKFEESSSGPCRSPVVTEVANRLPVRERNWDRISSPEDVVKRGDEIEVKILDFDPSRRHISFGLKQLQEDPLERCYRVGTYVVGSVWGFLMTRDGATIGALIRLGEDGIRGLLPVSNMDGASEDSKPENLVSVGDKIEVKILRIEKDKRHILLEMKRRDPWDSCGDRYKAGQVVAGKVTRLRRREAIVDLGDGISGVLKMTDMSWGRISGPEDIVKEGEEISVRILGFDPVKRHISFGLKQLREDPLRRYRTGAFVVGTVSEIKSGIACVRLDEEGTAGFLPISNRVGMSGTVKPKVGDKIEVEILSIRGRNIKLGMKRHRGTLDRSYRTGAFVVGTVSEIKPDSALIRLDEGTVTGFLHISEMGGVSGKTRPEDLVVGEEIEVEILSVGRKRIILSTKQCQGL